MLWTLGREVDNDRFLIDGICVLKAQRGKGVGSQLLAALYQEAAERGYGAVRLDVVENADATLTAEGALARAQ